MADANRPADNGVNVAALIAAREALSDAPEAAQFKWRAACEWKNGTHSHSTVEGFYGSDYTPDVIKAGTDQFTSFRGDAIEKEDDFDVRIIGQTDGGVWRELIGIEFDYGDEVKVSSGDRSHR